VAIKAMAAKLARLVYRMLRYGMNYVDQGVEFYETQHRKLQINSLKRKAAQLGFQIIEAPAAYSNLVSEHSSDANLRFAKNNRSKLFFRVSQLNQIVWPVIFGLTGPICARAFK